MPTGSSIARPGAGGLLCAPLGLGTAAAAAQEPATWAGLSLEEALTRLRSAGVQVVYSSDHVRPEMLVEREPASTEPRSILLEVLEPHGLSIADGPSGTLLVVRRAEQRPVAAARRARPTALDEIVISASHYLLGADAVRSPAVLTAADLEQLPDLGDDPLRAVARLPGVAAADFSSRTHLRGGAADEVLVRFDGLRLYDPYHFKDFLGVFSTVNPGLVSDISVYTGGFPVPFGDRSSGVVDITPRSPPERTGGEVGLSLLNAGGVLGGTLEEGAGEWLVAARRSNLDLFFGLTPTRLGEPSYYDAYGHFARKIGAAAVISANALVFDDRLQAFDSDREEDARAAYHDAYYWLRLDLGEAAAPGARVIAARTELSSRRSGSADLPGVGGGWLDDRRDFTIDSLQADAWRPLGASSVLQAGFEWRRLSGSYRYEDEAEFDLLILAPGAPEGTSRSRNVALEPRGHQYGAYANLRVTPTAMLTADLGLRWDHETLSDHRGNDVSPRAALRWQPREDTSLRLGWGRFVQSQGIDELYATDGETSFLPPQRAEHLVASIERKSASGLGVRVEAYRKDYDRVLPRWENLLNTLVVLPELKPDRVRIAPDSALAKGVEASLSYDSEALSGWLSYSWSKVEDRIGGARVSRGWDQRHSASGGVTYRRQGWEMSLAAAWHSGWPLVETELVETDPVPLVEAGERGAGRLSGYARLDARVARRFELEDGGELTVFAEVANLLKRGNDCCVDYDLEDEDGELIFDASPRKSLPLIPSIGFVWRF